MRQRKPRAVPPRVKSAGYKYLEHRRLFTVEKMSLADIAAKMSTPSERTLARISTAESWVKLRDDIWQRFDIERRGVDAEDVAAIRARHALQARALQEKGLLALATVQPEQLKPLEALNFLKAGTELEATALGLDVKRVELTGKNGAALRVQHDLSGASSEALLEMYRALLTDEA